MSDADLQLGELLHDGLFGLFEAMSAIEMMDPKMDAGMICNRGTKKVKSFDQAVEVNILFLDACWYLGWGLIFFQDGSLRLNNFRGEEVISIIDGTLACIVSWLEGHSLAQTVFTNLYLHKPYTVQDKVVRVFCLSVYNLLKAIKGCINK